MLIHQETSAAILSYFNVSYHLIFSRAVSTALVFKWGKFWVKSVTNSYFVLWEFSTSQNELLLVSGWSIDTLISGGDSGESWVLVRALGLL